MQELNYASRLQESIGAALLHKSLAFENGHRSRWYLAKRSCKRFSALNLNNCFFEEHQTKFVVALMKNVTYVDWTVGFTVGFNFYALSFRKPACKVCFCWILLDRYIWHQDHAVPGKLVKTLIHLSRHRIWFPSISWPCFNSTLCLQTSMTRKISKTLVQQDQISVQVAFYPVLCICVGVLEAIWTCKARCTSAWSPFAPFCS